MKVVKVGGGCLKDKKTIARIIDLLVTRGPGNVIVLSALGGVTDFLLDAMPMALADESRIAGLLSRLRGKHMIAARHLIAGQEDLQNFSSELSRTLSELERLLYGLNFTREITPRLQDAISAFGERFSVQLLTAALRGRKVAATYLTPHKIGMITDGRYGDATADLRICAQNIPAAVLPFLKKKMTVFIPGFYGINGGGSITTFGRGGSDYSAAVVARAMQAEVLEIWKDVEGFMSGDPDMVPEAEMIPSLSYEEAAELSYFGAKILHPRTIEPLRRSGRTISIRNTLNPDAPGSRITPKSARSNAMIKSVAYDRDIGILKVHASGVGARPGILTRVAGQLTGSGINIKSVVTSQTCISILLSDGDLETGAQSLRGLRPKPYRRIEKQSDVALVAIVGEGLLQRRGIAAQCFTAVAGCSVNIEMISFGPSRAALYFLVRNRDLHRAVNAIHSTFFSTPRCT